MENKQKIIEKILSAENERRSRVNALKQELYELEAQGEMCDADKIIEIIDELNLIDPLSEDEEELEKVTVSKPKRKRFHFKYVAAMFAFIFVAWLSYEAVSVTAFNNNFFDGTAYLSKAIIFIFRGNEMKEDDTVRVSSSVREYKTIEKLNKAEKVDIIGPNWLPDDITVENIEYHYDYDEKGRIYIKYDDGITYLTIKLDSAMPNDTGNAQIYKYNNIEFYVLHDSNIVWWEYNGNFYNFDCGFDITEYTDKVIENIK